MTTVQSANVGLGLSDYANDVTTPTTPRAPMPALYQPASQYAPPPSAGASTESAPSTPITTKFGGVSGQRPLPDSPFRNSFSSPKDSSRDLGPDMVTRGDSHRSIQSTGSQDVDMGDSDDGEGASDAESVDPETGRVSKKKKGQRFFCTEFPPCKLSFTRSEHLARHIRKHTGERPFQCHCSRRFSRLDNLRQHAQTVHVNEDIPGDSLAATGTRFQRQIRTDRVARPNSGRSRASTASSQGSLPRGHSRNLSASSVGSTASTISRDDSRRRPPPLIMSNEHPARARLSLDVLRNQSSTPPGQGSFFLESEGVSTPTSTTFSTGQNSPGFGSALGSPVSAVSQAGGFWDGRTHGRRLSVPSGPVSFRSPQGNNYGSPYLSPLASSAASTFSTVGSSLGSPTNTSHNLSNLSRREAAEAEWRRRTWHPSSYTYTNYSRPATSGLSYYQTPDASQPTIARQTSPAVSQTQRLPGIETFDQAPRRPPTPPRRGPSPMYIDSNVRPPVYPGPSAQQNPGPDDRKGHASWDIALHQNLTKLDIAGNALTQDQGLWNQQQRSYDPRPIFGNASTGLHPAPIIHQEGQKRPVEQLQDPTPTPNRSKRHGWYAGPPPTKQDTISHLRTSPEESSSSEGVPTTPSFPAVEDHPSIVHSNGYVERAHPATAAGTAYNNAIAAKSQPTSWPLPPGPPRQHYNAPKDTEMSGLEVLVAVATREENAAAAPNA